MLIRTKYRDVPSREIQHHRISHAESEEDMLWESRMRGREVTIETGAVEACPPLTDWCDGPFFKVIESPVPEAEVVCHHLAEIGD